MKGLPYHTNELTSYLLGSGMLWKTFQQRGALIFLCVEDHSGGSVEEGLEQSDTNRAGSEEGCLRLLGLP